ncbi:flagellar biosynthetic protein FliO [Massilia sp. PAMC28688]|nr:flagellar biosynthetic protein FliO [Massilia sp. PAMC28688]
MVRALPALLLAAAVLAAPALARQPAPAAAVPAAPAAQAPPAAPPSSLPAATAPADAPAAAPVTLPAEPRLRTAPALPQPAQPAVATSAGSLIQTIIGLSIVLATLALFAWAMKRFGPRPASGAAGLRIVGALNLGGRERIMVVEVGDQWIVVGASPGRVNALATMPRQEPEAGAGGSAGATVHPYAPSATSFSEWLKQTIDKRNAK